MVIGHEITHGFDDNGERRLKTYVSICSKYPFYRFTDHPVGNQMHLVTAHQHWLC